MGRQLTVNIDEELIFPGIEGLAKALRDRTPHLFKELPPAKRANVHVDRLGRAPSK